MTGKTVKADGGAQFMGSSLSAGPPYYIQLGRALIWANKGGPEDCSRRYVAVDYQAPILANFTGWRRCLVMRDLP